MLREQSYIFHDIGMPSSIESASWLACEELMHGLDPEWADRSLLERVRRAHDG